MTYYQLMRVYSEELGKGISGAKGVEKMLKLSSTCCSMAKQTR